MLEIWIQKKFSNMSVQKIIGLDLGKKSNIAFTDHYFVVIFTLYLILMLRLTLIIGYTGGPRYSR